MTEDMPCKQCKMRAKYDANPKSLIGKFWRWHINFCPGWKRYFTSLPNTTQAELREMYNFKKHQAQ